MDVRNAARSVRRLLLGAGLNFAISGLAHADPIYNAVDLGTGSVTYGVDSSGNGTITGSSGLTYTFNPVQNELSAQWSNTTQGVPTVEPAPIGDPDTYGNPSLAFSDSSLKFMNSQGMAAGINLYGVNGHMGGAEAFLTQQQANGSWGAPIPLWSGTSGPVDSNSFNVGILGVSPIGQVLGFGTSNPYGQYPSLFLYDTKTQSLTDLTGLINSMKWTTTPQVSAGQNPYWNASSTVAQLDNQGRLLVHAFEGYSNPSHNVLLVPQGVSSDPIAAPEPATWAVFATLIGGWVIHRRLRSCTLS